MSPDPLPEPAGPEAAVLALASLAKIADGEVRGVMLILQGNAAQPQVSQLRPTQKALPALNDVVSAAATSFADCELVEYEPATLCADGQLMWIGAAEVPLLKAIVDESADLANLPLFDPAKAKLANLQLAALRAEAGDASAVFIQSLRGNQIVAQSRRVGVIVRKGVIDLPPSGQILLFSKDVAAVVVGEIAVFRDRPSFQRLFGYLDELRQQAAATFEDVTADLKIAGSEQMALAVTGSPAMLGKMASIQRKLDKYPQYRKALTMPKLVAFVLAHPECGVERSKARATPPSWSFGMTRSIGSRSSSSWTTTTCAPNSPHWSTKRTPRARHSEPDLRPPAMASELAGLVDDERRRERWGWATASRREVARLAVRP